MTRYLILAGLGVLTFGGLTRDVNPDGSQAGPAGRDAAAQAVAGEALFHERGCVACHKPDGSGVGPALRGLFGSPIQDPGCGVVFVDESYVREAILNPSATVAVGYKPVMPSFERLLTEEELQALITYVTCCV